MGKQGPCYHCGTHSTPLWRNGPPDKPVLCNACGSRYRIRGSLANYAPKHAQGQPIAKRARISSSKTASKKENFRIENFSTDSFHSSTSCDDFTSSSESAMSYPQCCYNLKEEDEGEVQGITKRSSPWESCIPSRKRSLVVHRSVTPIERLQKDLGNVLKYEDPSNLAENEEDLLIYNANNLQLPYNEIGLGIFLLKPNSTSIELAHSKPHPSLLDIKISCFNESQNRSSSMDELKKIEPAADTSMPHLLTREELLLGSGCSFNHIPTNHADLMF